MPEKSHLTVILNATVITWHRKDDIQAVIVEGKEQLVINGKVIPLQDNEFWPTQAIINYCWKKDREQKAWVKAMLSRVA